MDCFAVKQKDVSWDTSELLMNQEMKKLHIMHKINLREIGGGADIWICSLNWRVGKMKKKRDWEKPSDSKTMVGLILKQNVLFSWKLWICVCFSLNTSLIYILNKIIYSCIRVKRITEIKPLSWVFLSSKKQKLCAFHV